MARNPQYETVYQAFSAFLQRCLLENRSLLWPEREVWTIANLEEVRRRFVEGFIQGRMTFREKLEAQLRGAPAEAWALVADCFYIYALPSQTIRFATKRGWVEWAAQHAAPQHADPNAPAESMLPPDNAQMWEPFRHGFAATGQKYNLKHAQLRLLVLLALEIKAAEDPAALLATAPLLQDLLDRILDEIPLKLDRANDMRSAILYMAFPDEYEPILSSQEKDAILRHYAGGMSLPEDRDAALREVRQALEGSQSEREALAGRPFEFHQDLREEWRPDLPVIERELREQQRGYTVTGEAGKPGRAIIQERRESWSPPKDPDLKRVLDALRLTHNVILSGPPGTGKTFLAHKAARELVEQQGPNPDTYIAFVTLHPSYSYEDFVEGLRPVLARHDSGGQGPGGKGARSTPRPADGERGVAYEVRAGVFREVCERAFKDPAHTYVLVIDEINRANLAKILGELITLIEDDKRGVLAARLPYSGLSFSVPANLVLLGTMNTADRSVALLDAALRRRFAFVEIGPRPDLLAGAVIETDEAVLHLDDLLRCLNDAIREQLGGGQSLGDAQIGHSYLLRVARAAPDERLALLDLVWNTQILPLLEEYFYSRRDRLAEILAPFVEDGSTGGFDAHLSAREPARLHGEDLVVALSRLCDGEPAE